MTPQRQGELYAVILSLLESWFPILALVAVKAIGPLNTYGFVLIIATAVLLLLLYVREGFGGLADKEALPDLLWTSFYITLLFTLVFIGLRYTTAGNMAVILTLQLFFSYLYFNLPGREKLDALHTFAAFLMGAGAVIILFPATFTFNPGDLLILIAAATAPLANLYQKRARQRVSALTILTFRNLAALPVLFGAALLFEGLPTAAALLEVLPAIAAVAVLVYVLAKILWIEALHRIGITKLSAMIAFMPLFTLIFAYPALGEVPTARQLLGTLPILLGAYLITRPLPPGREP
ncbi:DMT family transporter [Sulfurimonas diazotrophicus]|uniref:DMT family transporter n=1 Tax=Sulfurimonas diazotrophicus TaxID=3131939 RepID=A0ABZ3HDP9_9BACT